MIRINEIKRIRRQVTEEVEGEPTTVEQVQVAIRYSVRMDGESIYQEIIVDDFDIANSTTADVETLIEQNTDTVRIEEIYKARKKEKAETYRHDGSSLKAQIKFVDWTEEGLNAEYVVNDVVEFNGQLYRCVQPHTVNDISWTPEATAALWSPIMVFGDEFQPWQQPQGEHDAYPQGSIVQHSGTHWIALVGDNVWEPTAGGNLWAEYDPETDQQIGDPLTHVDGDAWQTDYPYEVGDIVTYNTQEYAVLQAHVSQTGWEPDATPSLFEEYVEPTALWSLGTSYVSGDIVEYNGEEFIALENHTSAEGDEPVSGTATTLWDTYPTSSQEGATIPEWDGNSVDYTVDDEVMYNGTQYICISAHTSQAGWNPEAVPSLWSPV